MRVVVTGGSGFLGREIVAAARARGHEVFAPRSREFNLESGAGVEEYLSGLVKIETSQAPFRPYKVIYYPSRFEFTPSFIVDISGAHDQKMKAVRAYKSQFHSLDRAEPESDGTLIGRPDFLEGIEARDKYYGAKIGAKFGEPFLVREALKLVDPVDFFGPEYLWARP